MKFTAPILGPVLAGTLALTGFTATPAQAGDDDLAKVLLGLTALTILGAAIADDDHAQPAPVYRAPPPRYHTYAVPARPPVKPRIVKRRLPADCLRTARFQGKVRNVFGKACLQRRNQPVARLPQSCERVVNISGQKRPAFVANCLRNHGWTS